MADRQELHKLEDAIEEVERVAFARGLPEDYEELFGELAPEDARRVLSGAFKRQMSDVLVESGGMDPVAMMASAYTIAVNFFLIGVSYRGR